MGSGPVLKIDELIADIPGEQRAGTDHQQDRSPSSLFEAISSAFTEARDRENRRRGGQPADPVRGFGGPPPGPANWNPILDKAPEFIQKQSKDLRIATYLLEALARLKGFAGLRDGFQLYRKLVDKFWGEFHPRPDAQRGWEKPFVWLGSMNGSAGKEGPLVEAINWIPLVPAAHFGRWHVEEAQKLESAKATDSADADVPKPQAVRTAVANASPQFFSSLLDDITECAREYDELIALVEQKLAALPKEQAVPPPQSSNIREAIRGCAETLKRLAGDKLAAATGPTSENPVGDDAGAQLGSGKARPAANGEIESREHAFQVLKRVAAYLRVHDRHTPVIYLLDRAVRWGDMPLADVLNEMIEDGDSRESAFKLAGIPLPQKDDKKSD
jgi:type VI secretion system protein ImpA